MKKSKPSHKDKILISELVCSLNHQYGKGEVTSLCFHCNHFVAKLQVGEVFRRFSYKPAKHGGITVKTCGHQATASFMDAYA